MTVDLTPPPEIDATGTVDVSDLLSEWFTVDVPDGATVTLPDEASYRLDYGLRIGSNGHARSHPGLPDRPCPRDLSIRGGARLFTDRVQKRGPDGQLDPRLANGLPLVLAYLADGLAISGGLHLDHSGRAGGKYDPSKEDWACLRLVGTSNVDVYLVRMTGAPGDAVSVNAVVVGQAPGEYVDCRDVSVGACEIRTIGRHAVTLQGVHGFTLAASSLYDVNRFLVDAELQAGRDAVDVTIAGNVGTSGGLGFAQLRAPARSEADRWTVDGNEFTAGHLHSTFGTVGTKPLPRQRQTLRFTRNVSNEERPRTGTGPLIFVGHFDDVEITGNRDRLSRPDRAVRLNGCGGTVDVETGNDWSAG